MEILDLQYQNTEIEIEFRGDGIDYFDYLLTIKDGNTTTNYNLEQNEIKDFIEGTERFLKQLKEKFNA